MKSGLNLYNAATSFEIDCSVEKYIAVARATENKSSADVGKDSQIERIESAHTKYTG